MNYYLSSHWVFLSDLKVHNAEISQNQLVIRLSTGLDWLVMRVGPGSKSLNYAVESNSEGIKFATLFNRPNSLNPKSKLLHLELECKWP